MAFFKFMRANVPARTVITCDMCGRDNLRGPEQFQLETVLRINGQDAEDPHLNRHLDLCDECAIKLKSFLDNWKESLKITPA